MKPAARSCYVLKLSVQPGGSRWAELQPFKIRGWDPLDEDDDDE